MSIHVILGKPGSGKSLYATSRLIRELAESERNVVTNLPLNVPRLNEYLQEKYPDRDLRMLQRLRVLTDDEIKTFWRIRGPDGDPGQKGVMYVLDEAHIAFNAREWANVGKEALHYLSQHRKLGDIVFPVTQAAGNLDKQFRSVAEDFSVLRNEYVAQYGIFRGRGRFVRKSYYSEPSGGKAEAYEVASFQLDAAGIASCYDTAKGIGVHGSKADVGRKAKGISIWWAFPIGLAIASTIGIVPAVLGHFTGKALGDPSEIEAKAAAGGLSAKSTPAAVSGPVPGERSGEAQPVVWIDGYAVRDGRINLVLSDGRTLTEGDPSLGVVTRSSAVVDGQRVYLRRPAAKAPADSAAVPAAIYSPEGAGVASASSSSSSSDEGSWVLGADGVRRLRSVPQTPGR